MTAKAIRLNPPGALAADEQFQSLEIFVHVSGLPAPGPASAILPADHASGAVADWTGR
jgi:hypothetical protein